MERQKEELKKQHPVPQNIMEVEFKLVGDMTLRQFGYVAAGAVIGYLIYAQPLTGAIRWPLILLDATLSLGMAFLPMEERGLDEWFRNFFTAVYSPTQRMWKGSTTQKAPTTKSATAQAQKRKGDKPAEKPKEPAQKDKKKATAEAQKRKERELAKKKGEKEEEVKELSRKLKDSVDKVKKEKPKTEEDVEKKVSSITKELDKILQKMGGSPKSDLSEKELLEENRLLKRRLVTLGEKYKNLKELEGAEETPANLKQTISYYKDQLETAKEKNDALQEELNRKKAANGNIVEEQKEAEKELKSRMEAMEKENKSLEEQIENLQSQIKAFEEKTSELSKKNQSVLSTLQEKEEHLKTLQKERTRAVSKMMELKSKLESKTSSKPEKEREPQKPAPKEPPEKGKAKQDKKQTEQKKDIKSKKKKETPEERLQKEKEIAPIIDNVPNVINGVVKDVDGDLLEGEMVIIEDSDGDPVRALKTNKLGQFAVSTPLPNARYTVKVNKGNYKPAKVKTDGSVLDPIVFREQ